MSLPNRYLRRRKRRKFNLLKNLLQLPNLKMILLLWSRKILNLRINLKINQRVQPLPCSRKMRMT